MTTATLTETTPTLSVDRKKLLAALNRVGGVLPARTQKDILHGVHLEAHGGELRMRGTDLDVSIAASVPCDGELPTCVVRCRDLVSRIKSGKGSFCDLSYDEERSALIVNGGFVEHALPTMITEDFPACDVDPVGQKLLVRSDELRPALNTCLCATAKEATRYALNAILLESDAKGVRLVATDGRRLAEHTLEAVEGNLCGQTLIPNRLAALLKRFVDPKHDEIIAIHVEPRVNDKGERQPSRLCVCGYHWRLAMDESEGSFPKYRDIIPMSGSRFVVDRKPFIELLAEVAHATDFECKSVRLDLSPDSVTVSARSPGHGEARGSIPACFTGCGDDRIVIAFNPGFLLDAAKTVTGPMFVIDVQQNKLSIANNKVISGPGLFYGNVNTLSRWGIMAVSLGLSPSRETLGSHYKKKGEAAA